MRRRGRALRREKLGWHGGYPVSRIGAAGTGWPVK